MLIQTGQSCTYIVQVIWKIFTKQHRQLKHTPTQRTALPNISAPNMIGISLSQKTTSPSFFCSFSSQLKTNTKYVLRLTALIFYSQNLQQAYIYSKLFHFDHPIRLDQFLSRNKALHSMEQPHCAFQTGTYVEVSDQSSPPAFKHKYQLY